MYVQYVEVQRARVEYESMLLVRVRFQIPKSNYQKDGNVMNPDGRSAYSVPHPKLL